MRVELVAGRARRLGRLSLKLLTGLLAGAPALLAFSSGALAQAQEAPQLNSGDTAWMLASTALVLMMTVPGVAMFYGGMVRQKNVLTMCMQAFATCCLTTVVWTVISYSLAFAGEGPYLGDLSRLLLRGMDKDTLSGTIPESVFMTFQMTFAIITPALITGAFADRMKFSALALVHGALGRLRLRADRPLGLGQGRLGRWPGCARFRRRHGGPHQLRRRRPGRRARARQAASATATRTWRRTI